jgi:hypothetical protein
MSRVPCPYAVQRAGTEGCWLPGWFGIDRITGHAAYFPTWQEAQQFVNRYRTIDHSRMQWGLVPRWEGLDLDAAQREGMYA